MKKIKNCFRKIRGFDYKIIFRMFELLVAAAAIGAFCFQYESLQEQRIATAWQILANKAAGNSGKIEAIQFLAKQKKSLQGIDMSKKSNGGQVCLRGLDVSKATLGHKAYLGGANFEGAYLLGAGFEKAYLGVANFEKAVLQEAHFEKADLFGAHFEKADLLWTHFEGASLVDAHFEGTDLWCTHFEKAVLQYAHFEGVGLREVNFEGANLLWTNFEGADLEGVHFEGASLVGNNLTRANFRWAKGMDQLKRFAINFVLCEEDKDESYLPTTAKTDSFEFKFDEAKPSEPELDNKNGKPTGRTKHFIKLVFKTPSNPN